jgi:hypothetical protein
VLECEGTEQAEMRFRIRQPRSPDRHKTVSL